MKLLIVLALVCGVLTDKPPPDPLSDEFIDYINSLKTTWTAGRNFHPKTSRYYLKTLMGVHPEQSINVLPLKAISVDSSEMLPIEFDSRKKWRHCPSISEIWDQGSCGSCWAFGAVDAMSDRICIHSGGKIVVHLSSENLLSCCFSCGFGCKGGFPGAAWRYWVERGIVSGGLYGCQLYEIAPCERHNNGTRKPCTERTGRTPKCVQKCRSSYEKSYKHDLFFGKSAYSIENDEHTIQTEIMNNGPVEGTLTVFEDLLSYKKGVYQHVAGKALGDHAIRILGWGVEHDTPYWLIANSWGTDWGRYGYFRILRGNDECGIESTINAGLPKPKI